MKHEKIEKNINLMAVLIVLVISIGGLVDAVKPNATAPIRSRANSFTTDHFNLDRNEPARIWPVWASATAMSGIAFT